MKRFFAFLLTLPLTAFAGTGSNYAECLIENMQGVANAQAHSAAIRVCQKAHPDEFYVIERGSGRGMFRPKSGDECTVEKSKSTPWAPAAVAIGSACRCLYDEAAYKFDMCKRYTVPQHLQYLVSDEKFKSATPAQQIAMETYLRKIMSAHPDAFSITQTNAFEEWLAEDASREEKLGDANAFIAMIAQYKKEKGVGLRPFTGKLD